MSRGDAFLQAILADPDDDAPRLIYADWLEERGDPRGAFIRLQCALERLNPTDAVRPDLEDEAGALLYQHEEEWMAPLQGIASEWRFRRGFIEVATVGGEEFQARGDDLFSAFPISHLRIKRKREPIDAIASSPHLARLRGLDVSLCGLRDRGVEVLLTSAHLTRLNDLNLAANELEGPAIRALVDSPLMGRLASLNLNRNGSLGLSAVRRIAQAPAAAALQKLSLSYTNIGLGGLRDLLASTCLGGLTSLQVGNIGISRPPGAAILGPAGSPVLSRLTALDLSAFPGPDGLSKLFAFLGLGRLELLGIAGGNLRREGVHEIANSSRFSALTALDLTNNHIGPTEMQMLAESPHLTNLTTLGLGDNSIRDAGARAVAASSYLTRLTTLDVSKNGIGGPGVQSLLQSPNLSRLTTLDMSENYVGMESVRAMAASPHLSRLARLRLNKNGLDDVTAGMLAAAPNMSRLSSLHLDENALSDEGLWLLLSSPPLTRLSELSLRQNGIGSRGVERLAAMLAQAPRFARLRKLDLRGNPLGDNERRLLRERFGARIELE